MKNVTKILTEEHNTIKEFISSALGKCIDLEKGRELDLSYFKKAVSFIKDYADKYHHLKEENILFPAMNECSEQLHCNPIPVMLHEHDTSREFVKGIEEGISEENATKIIQNIRAYCSLLFEHIHKEDEILYPMAEEALSDHQKDLILQKYDEVKNDKFSDIKIQEYFIS